MFGIQVYIIRILEIILFGCSRVEGECLGVM